MTDIKDKIIKLKKSKNALVLAHYYQTMDIQEVADHVGDSFALAVLASKAENPLIVLCGVHFMAESAKILNPDKKVLLPAPDAGCPMADMITPEDVINLKKKHPEASVVCYVNSSARVKAESDICCTSSSAERIVRSLENRQIIFIPDKNLGSYVAKKVPEKEIILFEGFCPIHHAVKAEDVKKARLLRPDAKILVHPECIPEVVELCDFTGSTAEILDYVQKSDGGEFIIGTERGVVDRLSVVCPDKKVYPLTGGLLCVNMKKTHITDLYNCLNDEKYEITLTESEQNGAKKSLERMVAVK